MDDRGIDLVALIGFVRRHAGLILGVLFSTLVVACVVVVNLRPLYNATALLLVDPTTKDLLSTEDHTGGSLSDSARVDGEAELVKAPSTLLEVARDLGLAENPAFEPSPGLFDRLYLALHPGDVQPPTGEAALAEAAARLDATIWVQRRATTFLIQVTAQTGEAALSARLANAVAATSIAVRLRAKEKAIGSARDEVTAKLADAQSSWATAEAAVDGYILAHLDAIAQASGDPQLAALRGRLATSSALPADQRPAGDGIASALREAVLAAKLPFEQSTALYSLNQTAEAAQAQYQGLIARQKELETQADLQVADTQLVEAATVPSTPSWPNPRLLLTVAAIVGLGLGIGVAWLRERFVGGMATAERVREALAVSSVSTVPFAPLPWHGGAASQSVADLITSAPLSPYSEAVRMIQFRVDQALRPTSGGLPAIGGKRGAVVMVSSALAGEGRTTLALSLARAFSESGRRTLLIDGDLRAPRPHHYLRLEESAGLIDYLLGGGPSLDRIIVNDPSVDLQVIVGGRGSETPTDGIVAQRSLASLIEAARRHFDLVVIDTPPTARAVEGLYIAGLADLVIIVVQWGKTPARLAAEASEALRGSLGSGKPMLAVLNQVRGSISRR